MGLGLFGKVPFDDRVYELGSNIDLIGCCVCCRDIGGGGADTGRGGADDGLGGARCVGFDGGLIGGGGAGDGGGGADDGAGGARYEGFGGDGLIGGGGGACEACPAARIAACIARFRLPPFVLGDGAGGGGGCLFTAIGGGGGAAGGGGAEEGGGGGTCDGFRNAGGAIGGFFPIGGGGPFIEADEAGLGIPLPAVFLKFATDGIKADVLAELWGSGLGGSGLDGGIDPGGFGAAIVGGLGADVPDDSGSDV